MVPNILGPNPPAAAWGDAAVIVPWVLYQRFGDQLLADQFDSMRAWVDRIDQIADETHLWERGFQFGDWLDPPPPDNRAGAHARVWSPRPILPARPSWSGRRRRCWGAGRAAQYAPWRRRYGRLCPRICHPGRAAAERLVHAYALAAF